MPNQFLQALEGGFREALFNKVNQALGIGVSPKDLHGQLRHQAMNARNAEQRAALIEASGHALDASKRDRAGLITQAGEKNRAYTPQYGAQAALGQGLAGVNRANAKYETQIAGIAQQEAAANQAAEQQAYDREQTERKNAQEDARIAAYGQGQSGVDSAGNVSLSANMEKNLRDIRIKIEEKNKARNGFGSVSDKIKLYGGSEGLKGKATEWVNAIFGSQTQASLWKTEWTRLVNSEIVNNLPPGVASDRDIALIKEGFPDSSWDKAKLQQWSTAYQKILDYDVANDTYTHDYVLDNGRFPKIGAFMNSDPYKTYVDKWANTTVSVPTPDGGTADVVVDFDFSEPVTNKPRTGPAGAGRGAWRNK